MTTIELLRHGKAVSRKSWEGPSDALRPLAPKGWGQVTALAAELGEGGALSAIYSSPLTRCLQTCEPLVERSGLAVSPDPRIGEVAGIPVADNGSAWVTSSWLGGRALGLVDEVVERYQGGRVVMCSHGDVIPALLAALAGRDGVGIENVRLAKGARVTLAFEGRRCHAAARAIAPTSTAA